MHNMNHTAGKLIVIDGIDGAGKTTQTELLVNYLNSQSIKVRHMKFPQYESFYGKMVAQFLRGEFGSLDTVSPYLASLLFALDRSAVRKEMSRLLAEGTHIVTDRYISSNIAHQSSKFPDKSDHAKYEAWLKELEYGELKLPEEDIVLFLDMPVKIAQELLKKQSNKKYLNGKKDIHEDDADHLTQTREEYIRLCNESKKWKRIGCVDESGALMAPTTIHQNIVGALRQSIGAI